MLEKISANHNLESIVKDRMERTYNSLSNLRLVENKSDFGIDKKRLENPSEHEIIDYCFLHALGNEVVQNKGEFEDFKKYMISREQTPILTRFWEANTVEEVLRLIEKEDITESKTFYTSLVNHLERTHKKCNENNIHEEILSLAIILNLSKNKKFLMGRNLYKQIKELLDLGFPARYSLEAVYNRNQ